jgi:hypothetical protein
VTYLIEYLGEFEFLFETVLGYASGDQMGSFEAKKTESKISCLGTFKGTVQQDFLPPIFFTDGLFPSLLLGI